MERYLSAEERPIIGALVNEVRDALENKIKECEEVLKEQALNEKLEKEKIDSEEFEAIFSE